MISYAAVKIRLRLMINERYSVLRAGGSVFVHDVRYTLALIGGVTNQRIACWGVGQTDINSSRWKNDRYRVQGLALTRA